MYYLIEWYGFIIVYNDNDKRLAYSSGETIDKAIREYQKASWDIRTQPKCNMRLTATDFVDEYCYHKILGKFKSLDDIQTTNPEFFI